MEKINITELLRDCPTGLELDCMIYDDVYFDYIDELNIIHCYIQHDTHKTSITFNQHGTPNSDIKSKCVIFPKGKTTWKGFHRPFKDGDVCTTIIGTIFIYQKSTVYKYCGSYISLNERNELYLHYNSFPEDCCRLATEEEKQKLFDAIEMNGYKWNAETKTLKLIEPRFKVGDRIRHKTHIRQENAVTEIKDTHYILDDELALPFISQDEYELIPNKFDITTLKPFDKVLYRMHNNDIWLAGFYNVCIKNNIFIIGSKAIPYCIPYEGNEHLLNTTNDCDDFYKTW